MRKIRDNIHFREADAAAKPSAWLMLPAFSILPLIRWPVGYDVITPMGAAGNLILSFALPYVALLAAALFSVPVPPDTGHLYYLAFIAVCAVAGVVNNIVRGIGLRRGAGLHSEEAGWSWLTLYAPLPPPLCELVLVPAMLAGAGWLVLQNFSLTLGAWLMLCAGSYVCLAVWEARIHWRAWVNVVNDIKRARVYSDRVGDVQGGAAAATQADDLPYAMAGLGGGKTRRKPRPADAAPDMAAWRRESDSLTPDSVAWFRRGKCRAGLPTSTGER